MKYLSGLTPDEARYICSVIPPQETSAYFRKYPKEFAKLRPGFRVQSLNKETVIRTLYDFRNKDFVSSFLEKHIEHWMEEIAEELNKVRTNLPTQESAYIDVLSRSYFSDNVALYFKIKGEEKTEEYLRILGIAVSFQANHSKIQEQETSSLKKELEDLKKNNYNLENRVIAEEQKSEGLRKKGGEHKEKLEKAIEQLEITNRDKKSLSEKVVSLEEKLRKAHDDEVWKTSEMQQKIESLTAQLADQKERLVECSNKIEEKAKDLKVARDEAETWKNQVRGKEKQLFSYKAERATLLTEKDADKKQIKDLKDALEKALSIENTYKERLLELSNEKESYLQRNRELEETIEEQKGIELSAKRYVDTDNTIPLCPESIDDFEECFINNLNNVGFNETEEGAVHFLHYIKNRIFGGVPLLLRRGLGINLSNCLANTLYGVPFAARLLYTAGADVKRVKDFLAATPDRVVCVDGFIGNCNEMELLPELEKHRNKIVILTYMYDRTLRYIPAEMISYVHFVCADAFSSLLSIKDITEEPSDIKEVPYNCRNTLELDSRTRRIFCEIACELGFREESANVIANRFRDEKDMNEELMFSLLPYVTRVFNKNPYNHSKRLQKYAGADGRCPNKDLIMGWFGRE